ncbi:MAG: DNA alkylation repair protein [Fimbriimonas sp.]|nr:DNA alkylation repair protein [Fimbriimonas sp.]
MTYDDVMARLEALGDPKVRKLNARNGAGENQFGVKLGEIRTLGKEIKANPELAAQLWNSGNQDAMLLATLLMKPALLSLADLDRMVGGVTSPQVADWLATQVVKLHPEKEARRETWMNSPHAFTARMGWSLMTERVLKNPNGLDIGGILDRIEREMGSAPEVTQWTMNFCLAEIGIEFPEHRARAIAIGEKIGAFRDYPTSKGCTSPFAPIWIAELASRKGT